MSDNNNNNENLNEIFVNKVDLEVENQGTKGIKVTYTSSQLEENAEKTAEGRYLLEERQTFGITNLKIGAQMAKFHLFYLFQQKANQLLILIKEILIILPH